MRKKLRKSIIKPITKSITQTSRAKPDMTWLVGGKATGKSAHFSQKRNATGSAKRNRYAMIEKARKFTGFG
ncbi:hypothetical protein ACU971_000824 [Escherichia coli]|uniref:hypothetical protein n=1 Tax=Escherichia coli TaxID=562 RepID=UPI00044F4EF4|nr:hypothetical protein [Escherichia coli]EYY83961.1 hypothetical protein BX73_14605 [Escherichia coli O111:NM str. 2010C-4735]EEC8879911.1 hypothetical protein [Escherichia coli]EET0283286.1 hypothetical protein [Escherichia coli]EEU1038688.1 hypothetical protein [Escherichia coli]EEW0267612.1 hypothetical protein [Escherichia coli]